MTTTRRGFFGAVAAAVGAMTLDPERALWIPGRKLISIPKPQAFGKMTAEKIVQAALQNLRMLMPGETPSRDDSDAAMFRLNAMVDSWGMPLETVGREHVESAIYGLTVRLLPLYRWPPTPGLAGRSVQKASPGPSLPQR